MTYEQAAQRRTMLRLGVLGATAATIGCFAAAVLVSVEPVGIETGPASSFAPEMALAAAD